MLDERLAKNSVGAEAEPGDVGGGGAAPLLVPNGCKSQTDVNAELNRKRARFLVRALRGVACGISKGFRFRWFVLTESDEAIADSLDFGKEFNRFRTWLKKQKCKDFQYIRVEHRQGDRKRRNWHILSYGSDKLPVTEIREYWESHFKSTVTGMAEVKDIDKAVKYLAGYLSSREKFVRCRMSQGWVYPGWVEDTKLFKKRYGGYLSSDVLCELSWLPKSKRDAEIEMLLETGYRDLDECLERPVGIADQGAHIAYIDKKYSWLKDKYRVGVGEKMCSLDEMAYSYKPTNSGT
jgi:hypothetical protein